MFYYLEHVSSQARVLSDGSVIYKYLNPNLVVMVTQSNDPNKRKVVQHHITASYSRIAIMLIMY